MTVTFRTEHTLTGYARAAIDLKTRMADYYKTPAATEYIRTLLGTIWPQADDDTERTTGSDTRQHPVRPDRLVDAGETGPTALKRRLVEQEDREAGPPGAKPDWADQALGSVLQSPSRRAHMVACAVGDPRVAQDRE